MPRAHAQRLARAKAEAVARALPPDHADGLAGALILAADTVVAAGRRILPAPGTDEEARACLALLSGRRHRVLTAIVLRDGSGRCRHRVVESSVAFARLTPDRIDAYVASGEGRGKAGGYAIQGAAASFVRFLSGSHSGVVGLPLFETAQLLRSAGFTVP